MSGTNFELAINSILKSREYLYIPHFNGPSDLAYMRATSQPAF
jgi:hypothetical protein